jgi:hypothetical protein
MIVLGTFEYLDSVVFGDIKETKFSKYDNYPFILKFIYRFGASTLSILLA